MEIKPLFYNITSAKDKAAFVKLKEEKKPQIFDEIHGQIMELVICQNPKLAKKDIVNQKLVEEKISDADCSIDEYGTWVYYPWKNSLVHTLSEEEFIEVRTNRNKYKITQEEQDTLRKKKVGIVGLSVGRSIATTLAIERVCGEIRLADFDELELSNLNRINAPLTELGKNKTLSAAHEILELDPYLKIVVFEEGLTKENMDSFFLDGGKIDILVEECDGLEIKILSRLKARDLGVPVIMETNDGCHIDVERFDLDTSSSTFIDSFRAISKSQKSFTLLEFLKMFFGETNISKRMNESIPDIGIKLKNWPQIKSEIVFGSAVTVLVIKSIFLKESGKNLEMRGLIVKTLSQIYD